MVIDELDVVGIGILPTETDPPLIVDADTVLAAAITLEFLEPVPRRHPKVVERLGGVHGNELPQHHAPELRRVSPHWLTAEQAPRIPIAEALDHAQNITRRVSNVKRYYWRLANAKS